MTDFPNHWGNLTPGHILFTRLFLEAARAQSLPTEYGKTTFDPARLFLFAHCLELCLKCVALWDRMPENKLKSDFGHDLARLFTRAKSELTTKPMVTRAEQSVRDAWRDRLRSERDEYAASTGNAAPDILTNKDICQNLDDLTLERAVTWLNPLHNGGNDNRDSAGSALRYFVPIHIEFPLIQASGRSYESVPVTLQFGCDSIRGQLDRQLKQPPNN